MLFKFFLIPQLFFLLGKKKKISLYEMGLKFYFAQQHLYECATDSNWLV